MATVTSGSMGWTGLPSTTGVSQRRGGVSPATGAVVPSTSPNLGPAAAYGITPEQQQAQHQQTGVDSGGAGYVSGQVAPPPPAGTVTRTAPTAPATTMPPMGGQIGGAVNSTIGAAGGTTTVQGGLTNGGTTTRTSSLTSGTSPGQLDNPNGSGTSTTWALGSDLAGNNAVGRGLDELIGTAGADLSPTLAAQQAAFGLGGNLDRERYDYRPGAAASQDRVQLDTTLADQTRLGQTDALGRLRDAATGNAPSAAELMMRREAGKNVAATLGQARALGGRSAGGAARAGTLASADILAKNTADSAVLRAGEQERARAAEIAALGGVRGQDQDQAAKNAGLAQEANANNLRSQLEQNELAEKHRMALLDEQLKAYGIGTQAAGATVGGAKANAEAENKAKGGMFDVVGSLFA